MNKTVNGKANLASKKFSDSLARLSSALFAIGLVLSSCTTELTVGGSNRVFSGAIDGTISDDGCATYEENGQTRSGLLVEGIQEGVNACVYSTQFVDFDNELFASITLSDQVDQHIFSGSLILGPSASNQASLEAMNIRQGGDGPILTIEAGVTVVFRDPRSFMLINRGAQLQVNGTAENPVVLTAASDPDIGGQAAADATQLWGGLIINGFAVTNSCSYVGIRGQDGFAFASGDGCHVQSEGLLGGQASYYGGANDGDSSGSLRYLIVKHAGAEVEAGNELNGITFNAIGSATTVENLQIYRAYDDGVEFFGGAVNVTNYLALYVSDDSIDIDSGYSGTVSHALVIQDESEGNRCIEADGVASYSDADSALVADRIARNLNSSPTLSNITCIVSANEGPDGHESVSGTHDPGEGLRLREGVHARIDHLIVTNAYSIASTVLSSANNDVSNNWCLDIDSPETLQAAANGDLTITDSIFACSLAVVDDGDQVEVGGISSSELDWLNAQTQTYVASLRPLVSPTADINPELALFAANSFVTLMPSQLRVPQQNSLSFNETPGH